MLPQSPSHFTLTIRRLTVLLSRLLGDTFYNISRLHLFSCGLYFLREERVRLGMDGGHCVGCNLP